MKKTLISLSSFIVLLASCTLEGAITTIPNDKDNTEQPSGEDNGNKENGENEDRPSDNVNNDENNKDETPQLSTSICLTQRSERLFSFEKNECVVSYPETMEGELVVEGVQGCSVSVLSGNTITVTPSRSGEIQIKASVGNSYNTFDLEAYDKLTLKVISEFSHVVNPVPNITLYAYKVSLCLENDGLPVISDKYDIRCEYQQTEAGSDFYNTFSGRIGINEPLYIATDATRSEGSIPTLKFKKITISGIKDKYTIALPDVELVNHYGDASIFEFIYDL